MRKFLQPAFVVSLLSVMIGLGWADARKADERGLDRKFNWRIATSGDVSVAVTRFRRGGLTATSTDGRDWEVEKILCGFSDVTRGASNFVAVGESGAVGVTTNGLHWRITSVGTNDLCGVFYHEGCFVASGCAPVTEFFSSRNGIRWKRHEVSGHGAEARLGKFLETWVTVPNGAAEQSLTSIANEVRALCRGSD